MTWEYAGRHHDRFERTLKIADDLAGGRALYADQLWRNSSGPPVGERRRARARVPAGAGGAPAKPDVFAENLDRPYGIVFHPPADPQYVYVAAANQVVRYPYRSGAAKAAGPPK